MKRIHLNVLLLFICAFPFLSTAQPDLADLLKGELDKNINPYVSATFKTTRLTHTHTIEMVKKNELDFRITHRFFDIAGDQGGIETLFGFDNVSDIRIAFEYGITDDIGIGFGRSKGGFEIGPKQVLDGYVKAKLLKQKKKGGLPFSIVALGMTELGTETKSENVTQINSFPEFKHRLSYAGQLIIASKISESLSLMVMPTYLHRNYVTFGDENSNFALGAGGRIKFTKRMAIIVDYFHLFSEYRNLENAKEPEDNIKYYNPLGIGLEIETGGHVFHLNFSNSTGIIETQYIPYTTRNWLDGQFRFGFNISRVFDLGGGKH